MLLKQSGYPPVNSPFPPQAQVTHGYYTILYYTILYYTIQYTTRFQALARQFNIGGPPHTRPFETGDANEPWLHRIPTPQIFQPRICRILPVCRDPWGNNPDSPTWVLLYYTILYYTILYYTILYYTIIVLYFYTILGDAYLHANSTKKFGRKGWTC